MKKQFSYVQIWKTEVFNLKNENESIKGRYTHSQSDLESLQLTKSILGLVIQYLDA